MERKSSDTYNLLQTDISQCCYRCIPISLRRLRTPSSLWARLDWHHNSSLWFPAPNAPLAARISPVGFHRTKESCQRPWQRVTSPSATAVMFRLLLTHSPFFLSPSLSWLWFEQETFSLSILSCHFFKHTYQSGQKRKRGGGGGKDVFFQPFYYGKRKLWGGKRERGTKTFVEISLKTTSFLLTTGNISFVLMQY